MGRGKVSRAAVIAAAVDIADASGLEALTMRAIAASLGVEAMSLYHYVAGKEHLLDGMVDVVYGEIVLPRANGDWRAELRRRSLAVREALRRHPWALPLMESRRAPGPATLTYHDANIACLRSAGFAPAHVAHAYAVIDAYVYGFVLQETSLPFDTGDEAVELLAPQAMGAVLSAYPNMVWFTEHVVMAPGYSFAREFEPGLDLVLDGIAAFVSHQG